MNKPIMTLYMNSREDGEPLQKILPQRVVEGTFGEALEYMASDGEDNVNTAYSKEDNRELAGRLRGWINDVRDDPDRVILNLQYVNQNNGLSPVIGLETRVSDVLGSMLRPRTAVVDGRETEYDEAAFVVKYHTVGGR